MTTEKRATPQATYPLALLKAEPIHVLLVFTVAEDVDNVGGLLNVVLEPQELMSIGGERNGAQ